jgi:broad specificity phosphatase PhoE
VHERGTNSRREEAREAGGGAAAHEQKMWVMRHGEREDEVNENWERVSDRPFDPPLTGRGRAQAYESGKKLATAFLASASSRRYP